MARRVKLQHSKLNQTVADELRSALIDQGFTIGEAAERTCTVVVWPKSSRTADKEQLTQHMIEALAKDELVIANLGSAKSLPKGFRDFQAVSLSGWNGKASAAPIKKLVKKIDDTLGRDAFALTALAESALQSARAAALIIGGLSVAVTGGLTYTAAEEFGLLGLRAPVLDVERLNSLREQSIEIARQYDEVSRELSQMDQEQRDANAEQEKLCSSEHQNHLVQAADEACQDAQNLNESLSSERERLLQRLRALEEERTRVTQLISERNRLLGMIRTAQGELAALQQRTAQACAPSYETYTSPQCGPAREKAQKLRSDYENALAEQRQKERQQNQGQIEPNQQNDDRDSQNNWLTDLLTAVALESMKTNAEEAEAERDQLCAPQQRAVEPASCKPARDAESNKQREIDELQARVKDLEEQIEDAGDIDAQIAEIESALAGNENQTGTTGDGELAACDPAREQEAAEQAQLDCDGAQAGVKEADQQLDRLNAMAADLNRRAIAVQSETQSIRSFVCDPVERGDEITWQSDEERVLAEAGCGQASEAFTDITGILQSVLDYDRSAALIRDRMTAGLGLDWLAAAAQSQSETLPSAAGGMAANLQSALSAYVSGRDKVWQWLRDLLPVVVQPFAFPIATALSFIAGFLNYAILSRIGRMIGLVRRVPPRKLIRDDLSDYDVFISYAHKDSSKVHKLADVIQKLGLKVWIDKDNIMAGEAWAGKIVKAIRESKMFSLMGTSNAYNSENVHREVYLAAHFKRDFRPLDLDNADVPDELLFFLANTQLVKLQGLSQEEIRERLQSAFG